MQQCENNDGFVKQALLVLKTLTEALGFGLSTWEKRKDKVRKTVAGKITKPCHYFKRGRFPPGILYN